MNITAEAMMELNILTIETQKIARVISAEIVINKPQDALELMVEANNQGAGSIILEEQHLHRDFFDLRTGLAGDIVQKFANYHMKLAVVGAFEKIESKNFRAFMLESNRGSLAFFVPDVETAIAKITG
jgi:hypothetical protein